MKRISTALVAVALGMLIAPPASAECWCVRADGTGDYPTIQTALNACACTDTILVEPGIYHEMLRWPETDGIVLMGMPGERDACILDGEDSYRPLTIYQPVTHATVVTGLTIRNGAGSGLMLAGASPTITGNVFTDNKAGGGGAIQCASSGALITDNLFVGNEATSSGDGGGAIHVAQANGLAISHNEIIGNSAYQGGGIQIDGGSIVVTDNTISGNEIEYVGAGILAYGYFSPLDVTIARNTIVDNRATGNTGRGGGILLWVDVSGTVEQNLIRGNFAADYGGGIVVNGADGPDVTAVLRRNLILENESPEGAGIRITAATSLIELNLIRDNIGDGIQCLLGADPLIQHNDIQGNTGFGLINEDELVTIMAEWNWWGDNSGPFHPTNLGGLGDEVSDHVDFEPWSLVSGDVPPTAHVARLLPNYPNPFNPSTVIAFVMPYDGPARLTVFALDGRQVTTLRDGPAPAGRHEIRWNGLDRHGLPVPSGVYVYRLTTDTGSQAGRMMLVR